MQSVTLKIQQFAVTLKLFGLIPVHRRLCSDYDYNNAHETLPWYKIFCLTETEALRTLEDDEEIFEFELTQNYHRKEEVIEEPATVFKPEEPVIEVNQPKEAIQKAALLSINQARKRLAPIINRVLVCYAGLETLLFFIYDGALRFFTKADLERIRTNSMVRMALLLNVIVTCILFSEAIKTDWNWKLIPYLVIQALRLLNFIGDLRVNAPVIEIEAEALPSRFEESDGKLWYAPKPRHSDPFEDEEEE